MHRVVFLIFFALLIATPIRAVEMNGSYDTTAPTNSNIANWVTIGNTDISGWGAPGITGWNYVGQIGSINSSDVFVDSASGTYLGNGWVLTAAHVGAGTFDLSGTLYTPVPGSGQFVTPLSPPVTGTTEDLYLFQIEAPPVLPSLTLSLNLPVAFSATQAGSSVAMLGFGGGAGLTWGLDTVTEINEQIDLRPNYPYVSNDFLTDNGVTTHGSSSINNMSTLVGGDSGGADFTFNAATQKWELTGINEVTGNYTNDPSKTFSGMVQLDTYAAQIDSITETPEPQTWALFSLGLAFVWGYSRRRRPI